jgi:SAM-dependent methyltransferase
MAGMYEESVRAEFTQQTEVFASARALRSEQALGVLVDLVPVDPGADWLEVASGPGMVSRAIAGRVASVRGIDLTPAMVAKAEEVAAAEGVENVSFAVGDVTALELADDSFDGAITRFSLHHIPVPGRVLAEMARVVRPGGWVVLADHLTDADADAAAWHEEIERLRDPSHWACLTRERLLAAGRAAGLELDEERVVPLELGYEDWLRRSSGGPAAAPLIDRLLAAAPPAAASFRVEGEGAERRLLLRNSVTRWRVPG